MQHVPNKRRACGALAAVAAAAAVTLSAAAPSAVAAASNKTVKPTASEATTLYAVGKQVCKTPKKAHVASCFAEIRQLVRKGTKGARAFRRAAGATGAGTIGPAGGLTPSDLGTAYGLTTTGGSGQTIAIVDAYNDPNINADLHTFDSQ